MGSTHRWSSEAFYKLLPEVSGQLGDRTVMDRSVHPPIVSKLHYMFDGWLGDDLITSFPCFLVTLRLRDTLLGLDVSGCTFHEAECTTSGEFEDLHPDTILPKFVWMRVSGKPGFDDVGRVENGDLIMAGRILSGLRDVCLEHCNAESWTSPVRLVK